MREESEESVELRSGYEAMEEGSEKAITESSGAALRIRLGGGKERTRL
jgi:hypothetical protein